MGSKIAVIGAGAFGGWTAIHLQREGEEVTLIDAWGPGNSRASSGGESRVIRSIYGPHREYAVLMARAYTLWEEWQEAWGRRLYIPTGGIWLFAEDDRYAASSLPLLEEQGIKAGRWTLDEASGRYPQINFDNVHTVFYETGAGYLLARQACRTVAERFVSLGGRYLQSSAGPVREEGRRLASIRLSDGSDLAADQFVFACGPWLGRMFPDAVGKRVRPTRQEVYYFGCPAGDERFSERNMPIWIDFHKVKNISDNRWVRSATYGIPGNEDRGFKIAEDVIGEEFDPTTGDRLPTREGIDTARKHLAYRFPGLGSNPPLLEARVCQYENTPDSHFILDRHPAMENVWIAGGGSGHGFKMGPAVGEMMAAQVLGKREVLPKFSFQRLLAKDAPESDAHRAGAAGAFGHQ